MTLNRTLAAWVAGLGVWAVALVGLAVIDSPSATLERTLAELESGLTTEGPEMLPLIIDGGREDRSSTGASPALRAAEWPHGPAQPSAPQQALPQLRF